MKRRIGLIFYSTLQLVHKIFSRYFYKPWILDTFSTYRYENKLTFRFLSKSVMVVNEESIVNKVKKSTFRYTMLHNVTQ